MRSGASERRFVLGLDSCGAETTLCLGGFSGSSLHLTRELVLPARTAGARLTGALREILGEDAPSSLAALIVVRGPGGFTGMRVGLSAAKALSEAADVPLVAVSRLEVLAKTAGAWCAALDAGRGSVFLRLGAEEKLCTAAEARAAIGQEGALAVCEEKVAAMFPGARQVEAPKAADALRHAQKRIQAHQWDDTAALDGLYLWQEEQMLRKPEP